VPSKGTIALLAVAAVAVAVFASKDKPTVFTPPTPDDDDIGPPTPDPIDVEPVAVTSVQMTSVPTAGPVHVGKLLTDASWTIHTQGGSLVIRGNGETAFLDAWHTYTNGAVDGLMIAKGVMVGFDVAMPGCAAGFPTQWCYRTTWPPRTQRHVHTRFDAIKRAIARARAGG